MTMTAQEKVVPGTTSQVRKLPRTKVPAGGTTAFQTGWNIPETAELQEYVNAFTRAGAVANWIRGDIVAQLERVKGEATLKEFTDQVNDQNDIGPYISLSTMQEYRKVAVAYPPESRRLDIPWSVHHVFASQDDRLELIAGWSGTVREAREFIRDRKAEAYAASTDMEAVILGCIAGNKRKNWSGYDLVSAVMDEGNIPEDDRDAVLSLARDAVQSLIGKGQIHRAGHNEVGYGPEPEAKPATGKQPRQNIPSAAQPKVIPATYQAGIRVVHEITPGMTGQITATFDEPRPDDWPARIENSSYPFCPDQITVEPGPQGGYMAKVEGFRILASGNQSVKRYYKHFRMADAPEWLRVTVASLLAGMMEHASVTVGDMLTPAVEAFQ